MYRLATLMALCMALLAGCGGGSDEGGPGSPSAVARAPESGSDEGQGAADSKTSESAKRGSAKKAKSGGAAKPGDASTEDEKADGAATDEAASQESSEDSQADTIEREIRYAVLGTLPIYNLKLARLVVADGGHRVTVVVTQGSACNALAADEPEMRNRIRMATPIVKTLRFEVDGTGQELGYYVLSCKRPKMPNGPGKVLWEHSAVGGPVTSPRFTVTGDEWALEYENTGNELAIVVIPVGGKAKGKYFAPIGARGREVGRKTYGGPGVFQLKIHGAALWSVRVKDVR